MGKGSHGMTGDCQESASFQLLTTCKFLIDIEAMKKGRTGNPHSVAKKKKMSMSQQVSRGVSKKLQCYLMLFSQHKTPIPHAICTDYVITRLVM